MEQQPLQASFQPPDPAWLGQLRFNDAGLIPAIACIDASSVQQPEMVARDRGRTNRSTRAARSIDAGSKSL